MKLDKLLQSAGCDALRRGGAGDPDIGGVTVDSRRVKPGDVFVAVPGTKQRGDSFVADARSRGAAAIVSQEAPDGSGVPWAQVANARAAAGLLAKAAYAIDINEITLVGVTGTNGKTTTAHLFKKLFDLRFGADRVWMFGTIDYQLGTERMPAPHTTPESSDIFRLMGSSARPPQAMVMEVSSHALALDRVAGLGFDAAVFTNLTQDHLDFHGTMENYYEAKRRLFSAHLKKHGAGAINVDDPWGRKLAQETAAGRCVTFGRSDDAQVRICDQECSWEGTRVELRAGGRSMSFSSALRGTFNVYNMTALAAGALALSFDEREIATAFSAVETVPGRMDRVPLDAPFAVIVDYAHTPDALVNILQTARPLTKGRVLCVFGCGGDRDRTKRPLMGAAVAGLADEAIVTSDNPRTEKPEAIIGEILKGVPLDFPHRVVPDRRDAVRQALEMARAGDCVVVAGKGHETYQEINGTRYPFDDREIVAEAYRSLEKKNG